jgi:hypothetical protein
VKYPTLPNKAVNRSRRSRGSLNHSILTAARLPPALAAQGETKMIVDWIVYGLIIWGLATILNKTAFKNAPASRGVAWGLTILLFFVNVVALSAAKFLRYQVISEDIGTTITPSNPLDMGGAFIFAYLFFSFLNKKEKVKTEQ